MVEASTTLEFVAVKVNNDKSLEAIISIKDGRILGSLLACYIFGKLASDLKHETYTETFFSTLICSEESKVGDSSHRLLSDSKTQLTKFLQIVFRSLLRIQVQLDHGDLMECLENVEDSELKLVISVAPLGTPEDASESQSEIDELLRDLDANDEVKAAMVLSYTKLETADMLTQHNGNRGKMNIPNSMVSYLCSW